MTKSNEDAELFNMIYRDENPLDIFLDPDSPYYDYFSKVEETATFRTAMIRVSENKSTKWSMSQEDLLANIMIAYYASYFELFCEDDLVDSFYQMFKTYCNLVISGRPDTLFKDILGDTFLHYCAVNFNCNIHIMKLQRLVAEDTGNVYDLFGMKNYQGESISDLIC